MSISYIRKFYGVPAKRGCIVVYSGGRESVRGVIKSAAGAYLKILLDSEKRTRIFHPTYSLAYLKIARDGGNESAANTEKP
jgi:hypothetical protein